MFEKFKKWIKEHKVAIAVGGTASVVVGTLITAAVVAIVKNNKALEAERTWLHNLSDEELDYERELERLAWLDCGRNHDGSGAYHHECRMEWFDRESRRRYDERHPSTEWHGPVHREHGWYLPNDD